MNQVGTVRFGFGFSIYRGNGSQNLATLCSGDGTRPGRFRRGWPDNFTSALDTGFEEIGVRAVLRSTAFRPTGLLARVVEFRSSVGN